MDLKQLTNTRHAMTNRKLKYTITKTTVLENTDSSTLEYLRIVQMYSKALTLMQELGIRRTIANCRTNITIM